MALERRPPQPPETRAPDTPPRVSLLPPSDGARFRRLTLELETDGGITLLHHDMGGSDEAAWGGDDEELTVRLDPADAARLAFALLAERLKGRSDAVQALLTLCETHDVEAVTARWT